MARRKRAWLAAISGIFGTLILVHLWLVLLAPAKWVVRYPGGLIPMVSAIFLSTAMSLAASIWGSRKWLVLFIAALATIVYLAYATSSPWWS